jgi:hypothetical protein
MPQPEAEESSEHRASEQSQASKRACFRGCSNSQRRGLAVRQGSLGARRTLGGLGIGLDDEHQRYRQRIAEAVAVIVSVHDPTLALAAAPHDKHGLVTFGGAPNRDRHAERGLCSFGYR